MVSRRKTQDHNFNPLPPCGGRRGDHLGGIARGNISIHSLRVEGDKDAARGGSRLRYFNPLPPCGGRHCPPWKDDFTKNFNPLPPCGGRPLKAAMQQLEGQFQSTPSVWRETAPAAKTREGCKFQSTPSVWRETRQRDSIKKSGVISIHSLRVEGDGDTVKQTGAVGHFNPLPPCGGRLNVICVRHAEHNFNPLPPCGGRRPCPQTILAPLAISIHSLRVEGDCPHRRRRGLCHPISIHSLRVEGDPVRSNSAAHGHNFNPLPPCGGRPS